MHALDKPLRMASLVLAALASLAAAHAATPTVQERLGHPKGARLLVIHADDVGMSHSVNRATFEALDKGWITSASILVPCPWFPEVAEYARAHPDADLGIHLALNSEWTTLRWGPISGRDEVASLLDPDGYFPLVEGPVAEHARAAEVERELRAQVDRARAAGIRISHLDSHMGTLGRTAELFAVYRRLAAAYRLPQLTEGRSDRGEAELPWLKAAQPDALVDRVLGIEPGVAAADWVAGYEKLLAPLPPGVYELIVHLAYEDEEMRGASRGHPDWGAAWRQHDLDLVKDAGFRDFLSKQGFVLVSWRDLARAAGKPATGGSTP